jgi:hypothetical protein
VSVFVPPINRFLTCSIVGLARGKFSLAFASIKLIHGLQEKLKLAKFGAGVHTSQGNGGGSSNKINVLLQAYISQLKLDGKLSIFGVP